MCSLHWEKRLREREKVWGKVKKRDRYNVCVCWCVCVCVWERERESWWCVATHWLCDSSIEKNRCKYDSHRHNSIPCFIQNKKINFFIETDQLLPDFFFWIEKLGGVFSLVCRLQSSCQSHFRDVANNIPPCLSWILFKEKGWFSPKKKK